MESTFIILTQFITFGTAWSMFHCVLKRKKKDWFSLVGALGYLLLPYHVYVVTESVDRSQILIWMVVPILAASLVKMSDTEKMFRKTGYGLTAVLALGIIGRLDDITAPERECTQIQCGYEYFPQYLSPGFFFHFPAFHAILLHSY